MKDDDYPWHWECPECGRELKAKSYPLDFKCEDCGGVWDDDGD